MMKIHALNLMLPQMAIKILHTIRQGKIGGGETHVLDLVAHLDDRFTSEVLAFTHGEMVDRLSQMGVTCHVIETERPFDVRVWGKTRRLMQERGIQVVHAHGTRACSNSFWGAQKLDLPLLYTIHGWSFHPDQTAALRYMRLRGERFLVHRTDQNISVSQSNNQDGIRLLDMPNSQVVTCAVNTVRFNPDQVAALKKEDLGIPNDKLVVGFLARLTKQKDPLTFVRAAAEVLKSHGDVHFALVGGGELEADCRSLATALGVTEKLHFIGFRTDVPDVLKTFDVYCLPSLWEGLPIGVLEAMAMKKAIVATPVDGTKEVIEDEVSGLFFPEYDHMSLASCIRRLVDDSTLRTKLGQEAHRVMNRSFGIHQMAHKIAEIYFGALKAHA